MSNRLAIDPSEIKLLDHRPIRARLMNGNAPAKTSTALGKSVDNFPPEKQMVNSDIVAPASEGAETVPDIRSLYKMVFLSFITRKSKTESILQRIADLHDVSISDIRGRSRARHVVAAKHHATYALATERPDLSIAAIGRILHKDHTTAIYSLKRYIAAHGLPSLARP